MKRPAYSLIFLLLLSCGGHTRAKNPTHIFTLKGSFNGKIADSISLIYRDTNGKRIELISAIKKGLFSFKGPISGPVYADLISNIEITPGGRDDISNATELFLAPEKLSYR